MSSVVPSSILLENIVNREIMIIRNHNFFHHRLERSSIHMCVLGDDKQRTHPLARNSTPIPDIRAISTVGRVHHVIGQPFIRSAPDLGLFRQNSKMSSRLIGPDDMVPILDRPIGMIFCPIQPRSTLFQIQQGCTNTRILANPGLVQYTMYCSRVKRPDPGSVLT